MRNFKKLLMGALIAAMALSLVACGGKDNAEDAAAGNLVTEEPAEVEATQEPEATEEAEQPEATPTVAATKKPEATPKPTATVAATKKPEATPKPTTAATATPVATPKPAETTATPAPTVAATPTPTPATPTPEEKPAPSAAMASKYIGQRVGNLVAAIGQPNSKSYASSCIGDGEDGEWYYNGFTVYTYRDTDGTETVEDVF